MESFKDIFDILVKFIDKEKQIHSLVNKQASLLLQAYTYCPLHLKQGLSETSFNPNINDSIKENMQYILKVLDKPKLNRQEQV